MNRALIGIVLIACLPPLLTGCSGNSSAATGDTAYTPWRQETQVDVVAVQRRPMQTEVEFTGNLLPRRVTRVISEIDGTVKEVPQVGATFDVVVDGTRYTERLGIAYGQQVRQDDVLVKLDTRDADVALLIAEAKLKKAQADLAQLKSWERPERVLHLTALKNEASAKNDHALLNYRRVEALVKSNAATASELEKAAMDISTTKASLEAAEATLLQASAGPTEEEIAVQESLIAQAQAEVAQKQHEIEKATIKAPYDGVITAFDVEVGDRVSPTSNPVAELMDLRFLAAEIAVPESFVGQVNVSDSATVKAAGSIATVPGLVIAINDFVDPQTRTFQVRVAIDNKQRRFKAGQFATAVLSIGKVDTQQLAVPNSAIVFVEGEPNVFVVNGGRVRTTPVETGISNVKFTEIVRGLQAGDSVVVDDPTLLSDGMNVSVRQSGNSKVASR